MFSYLIHLQYLTFWFSRNLHENKLFVYYCTLTDDWWLLMECWTVTLTGLSQRVNASKRKWVFDKNSKIQGQENIKKAWNWEIWEKEDRHRNGRHNNSMKIVPQFICGWCAGSSTDSAAYLWLTYGEFYRQCCLSLVDVQGVL